MLHGIMLDYTIMKCYQIRSMSYLSQYSRERTSINHICKHTISTESIIAVSKFRVPILDAQARVRYEIKRIFLLDLEAYKKSQKHSVKLTSKSHNTCIAILIFLQVKWSSDIDLVAFNAFHNIILEYLPFHRRCFSFTIYVYTFI